MSCYTIHSEERMRHKIECYVISGEMKHKNKYRNLLKTTNMLLAEKKHVYIYLKMMTDNTNVISLRRNDFNFVNFH